MNDCEHETWSLTYKKTRILKNLEATEKLNLENIGARSHANVFFDRCHSSKHWCNSRLSAW